MVGEAIGGAAAGMLQAGLSAVDSMENRKAQKAQNKQIQQNKDNFKSDVDSILNGADNIANANISNYYNGLDSAAYEFSNALSNLTARSNANNGLNLSTKNVDDYRDATEGSQIDSAMRNMAARNLFNGSTGSDELKNMITTQLNTTSALDDKAYERMNADKNYDLNVANANLNAENTSIQNALNNLNTNYQLKKDKLGRYEDTITQANNSAQNKLTALANSI